MLLNLGATIPHLLLSSDNELFCFHSDLYTSKHGGTSGYNIIVSSNVLRYIHG